jgi:hypothetical protein
MLGKATGGDTVRRIVLIAALLLPAGCSSLDSIPLSDVPIPEAAPRVAETPAAPIPETAPRIAETPAPIPEAAPRIAAEPPAPMPPRARPQSPNASAAVPSAFAAVEPAASGSAPPAFQEPAGGGPSSVKNAGHAIAAAVDTLLSPLPVMAFANEVHGNALIGDGALYRPGLVERRDVVGESTIKPQTPPPSVEVPTIELTPVSFSDATLSRVEVPPLNARTFIWVMIGFAALLGLFLSARRTSD